MSKIEETCHVLGVVAAEPYAFSLLLEHGPRSLAVLSREHRDGWGVAAQEGGDALDWQLHRSTQAAGEDSEFLDVAERATGRVLVAHVGKTTVGAAKTPNTHPLRHGAWVFTHSGAILDTDFLRRHASPDRLAERGGDTDSELMFAYLLTALDTAGVADEPVSERTDLAVRAAARAAVARSDFGTASFLLAGRGSVYAHRFGSPLYLLERIATSNPPGSAARADLEVEMRTCIAVASEPITNEGWILVSDGMLLRLDSSPTPSWIAID